MQWLIVYTCVQGLPPAPTVATPAPVTLPKQEVIKDTTDAKEKTTTEATAAVRSFVEELQPLVHRGKLRRSLDVFERFVRGLEKDTDAATDAANKRELDTPLTELRDALLALEDEADRTAKLLRLRTWLKTLVKKNLKMVDFGECVALSSVLVTLILY